MTLRPLLNLIIAIPIVLLCGTSVFADELETIKSNYRDLVLSLAQGNDTLRADFVKIAPETEMSDQAVVELHQRYPLDAGKLRGYIESQNPDGSWPDINYADTKRSGWEPKMHAERVLELAKAYYTESSGLYKDAAVMAGIHKALGYWFTNKPKCRNWWYNEIGVPKTMGSAFILLEDELTPEEREGAVEVMSAAIFKMTGQNKVWLAGNIMTRALLQGNRDLVKQARDTIASEICLGREEGIKDDWSFHQHGPQQQFGNYGLSYVSGMSFFHRLFAGTPMAFDSEQERILTSLINEGYRWVIWRRHMDVSALGRQLFHHAQLHKGYGLAFAAADMGLTGFPADANPLVGHKHFFDSDYTVHRSPSWMCSVKMSSSRVIGSELVNEDNLKGYYLGDGATFYYVTGDEYLDVFPFWDWRKIPGVTAYEDTAPLPSIRATKSRNSSPLVGGLDDGQCGMSVMKIERDGLVAHKAWVCGRDFVLCLGAGIASDSARVVTTSIDQRNRRGKLSVLDHGKWSDVERERLLVAPELRLHHDRTGYIVLGNDVIAEAGRRTGQWHDFMSMYRPATVEGEVMSLYMSHGMKPEGDTYAYIVLPDKARDEVEAFDLNSNVRIVLNAPSAQVVQLPGEGSGYWIAAYTTSPVTVDGVSFIPEAPGVYYAELRDGSLQATRSAYFKI